MFSFSYKARFALRGRNSSQSCLYPCWYWQEPKLSSEQAGQPYPDLLARNQAAQQACWAGSASVKIQASFACSWNAVASVAMAWPVFMVGYTALCSVSIRHVTVLPLQTLDNTQVSTHLTRAYHLHIFAMPNNDLSREEAACHPSPVARISPGIKGNVVQQAQSISLILGLQTLGPSPFLYKSSFLLRRALKIVTRAITLAESTADTVYWCTCNRPPLG